MKLKMTMKDKVIAGICGGIAKVIDKVILAEDTLRDIMILNNPLTPVKVKGIACYGQRKR